MTGHDDFRKPINTDPFGALRPGEFDNTWEGEVPLPAWRDCTIRWEISDEDAWEADDPRSEREKQGFFKLVINAGPGQGPGPEHEAAYRYLLANDQGIHDRVLQELAEHAREYYFTPLLEDCDDEDFARQLRHFGSPQGIRDLLGPPTVTLHRQAEDGQAKFSFDCNCAWDEEHGVGVLMHKDKVVEVAGSSENCDL